MRQTLVSVAATDQITDQIRAPRVRVELWSGSPDQTGVELWSGSPDV